MSVLLVSNSVLLCEVTLFSIPPVLPAYMHIFHCHVHTFPFIPYGTDKINLWTFVHCTIHSILWNSEAFRSVLVHSVPWNSEATNYKLCTLHAYVVVTCWIQTLDASVKCSRHSITLAVLSSLHGDGRDWFITLLWTKIHECSLVNDNCIHEVDTLLFRLELIIPE